MDAMREDYSVYPPEKEPRMTIVAEELEEDEENYEWLITNYESSITNGTNYE